MQQQQAVPVANGAVLDSNRSWLAVLILLIIYVFGMIDRQVMTMMVDPIRKEMGISDVEVSLLLGLSFALFYTAMGIPMGWLADRVGRVRLIAVSVALWGMASAACGLAESYGQLFLARTLVGVGEAALAPAAYSILSDCFTKRHLALAMSVYASGGLIGGSIALLGSGAVLQASGASGMIAVPWIGDVTAWRAVFLATGLPGPLLALFVLFVREPVRTGLAVRNEAEKAPSIWPFLKRHAAFFTLYLVGVSGLNMINSATVSWIPTHLSRALGVPPLSVGALYAALLIFAAFPGQLFAGWLLDRQVAKGRADFYLRWFIYALPLCLPVAWVGLHSKDLWTFILFLFPVYFVAVPFVGATMAAIQRVTPNEFRANHRGEGFHQHRPVWNGLGRSDCHCRFRGSAGGRALPVSGAETLPARAR
jgi:MFS family permease